MLEKHRALKHGTAITTTSAKKQNMKTRSNTLTKKRKNDDTKKTSSESPKKKKRKTSKSSAREVDNSPTLPTLRSRSDQKHVALTTPTTPNLRKRQLDRNSGESTADKNLPYLLIHQG
jgi:hypothetical protein